MSPSASRVLGLVLVALLVAAGCTFAGFWQWQRGEDRERDVEILRGNFSATPVAIDAILESPTAPLASTDTWRPVTLEGRYVEDSTVLLRNRPVSGSPAFHLLAPFTIDAPGSSFDGAVLVVDRGWVPLGQDAAGAASVPEPPTGDVSIEVRLRPAERESPRTAPPGQSHSIAPAPVLASTGLGTDSLVAQAYGSLVEESPAPAVVPGALDLPSTDFGPHRSYAMQWWVFALGALVGFGILASRELRGAVSADEPAPSAPERRQRRRPTAEEEEDALIDAQASETRSR